MITNRGAARNEDRHFKLRPTMNDWNWRERRSLVREIETFAPDGVILHFMGRAYANHPMITLLPAFLKRRLPNPPKFVTVFEYAGPVDHTCWTKWQHMRFRLAARRAGWNDLSYGFGSLLRDSDGLIVLAQSHADLLASQIPACRARISLCPPPSLVQRSPRTIQEAREAGRRMLGADKQTLIGFFGFIYPYKGLETLIDAAAMLARTLSRDWRICLIGGTGDSYLRALGQEAYPDKLRKRAREAGIEHRLIWTGFLNQEDDTASCCLSALDLCVLPFDSGVHLNNSSFAAAALHGLPIITTQGRNTEAAFAHGINCCLIPPKDPEALANSIVQILADDHRQSRLGDGAIRMTGEWFSWDRLIRKTLESLSK